MEMSLCGTARKENQYTKVLTMPPANLASTQVAATCEMPSSLRQGRKSCCGTQALAALTEAEFHSPLLTSSLSKDLTGVGVFTLLRKKKSHCLSDPNSPKEPVSIGCDRLLTEFSLMKQTADNYIATRGDHSQSHGT